MYSAGHALGILELDEGILPDSPNATPRAGSLLDPASFGRPIITEMVEGATAEVIIRGEPALEANCISAARRLRERGAQVIVADCGFFIRHQAAISAVVDIPVATSSLLLIPLLLRLLPSSAKLAVITADARYCTQEILGVEHPADLARVIIGGIEGGIYVRNTLARPFIRTDVEQIELEVQACIDKLRAEHPEIGTVLFECTGFPCVAPAVRRTTGLPVFDITDLCRLTLASLRT